MPHGLYVANVTPFRADENFSVDERAYLSHVEWLAAAGVDGVVPFGTNGEGPLVSLDEKLTVLRKLCPEFTNLNVIPTVTEQSLPEARRAVRELNELPIQAILALPPYYYKPASVEGLRRFFEGLVEVSRHPVLIYNIPKYALSVDIEIVDDLPVWGVKDSSGDDSYTRGVLEIGKGVLAGTENDLWGGLKHGINGSISALANFIPEQLIQLFEAFYRSDEETGQRLAERLQEVRIQTKNYPTPAVLKALAEERNGISMGTVRPPLLPLPPEITSLNLREEILRPSRA